MVRACVKGRSISNWPMRKLSESGGRPIYLLRFMTLRYPSPSPAPEFAPPADMSLSIQKESIGPKVPAPMTVKVLGTKRSVRGTKLVSFDGATTVAAAGGGIAPIGCLLL